MTQTSLFSTINVGSELKTSGIEQQTAQLTNSVPVKGLSVSLSRV